MIVTQASLSKLAWKKEQGMLPAIAQDHISGQVLMLAYMNKEALEATLATGKATFFSRSRQRIWCKGESSGNTLYIQEITADCDADTLLLKVKAEGPACHKGTTSCWNEATAPSLTFLALLDTLLESKKTESPENSYTASLYDEGVKRIAQKVGEEGIETALAAVAGDHDELINESADLLYHLMVLLKANTLSINDVIKCLQQRHRN